MEDRFKELTPEEQLILHHALVVLRTHPRWGIDEHDDDEKVKALIEELWALHCARIPV